MQTWIDETINEIHEFRLQHGKKFGYDIHLIVDDLQRQERESKHCFATIPIQKKR
jgi:hypothetical protein